MNSPTPTQQQASDALDRIVKMLRRHRAFVGLDIPLLNNFIAAHPDPQHPFMSGRPIVFAHDTHYGVGYSFNDEGMQSFGKIPFSIIKKYRDGEPDPQPQGEEDVGVLGRFDHHPDPATDFCIEVESLQSRLFNAKHGLAKMGTQPETVEDVCVDIERAMSFRVGGDEIAVRAKNILRGLVAEAASFQPTPPPEEPLRRDMSYYAELKRPEPDMALLFEHAAADLIHETPTPPPEPVSECRCSLRTKLVGDGCAVCNPERAADYAEPVSEGVDDEIETPTYAQYLIGVAHRLMLIAKDVDDAALRGRITRTETMLRDQLPYITALIVERDGLKEEVENHWAVDALRKRETDLYDMRIRAERAEAALRGAEQRIAGLEGQCK